VGKSRLAAEGLEVTRSQGLPSAWGVATQTGAAIPFGALAHLLPNQIPAAPDRENVLRVVADAMVEGMGSRRFVLGVDDAHLLDDHSAALVHHVALTNRAFVLLTVRTGTYAPDAVTSLWKDQICERLEVLPLSRDETVALLELAVNSQVDGTTGHRLWQLTAGNPLYLREVVRGVVESGGFRQEDGLWRLAGDLGPSARLREVLSSRLGGLEAVERETLELVALGEPLEMRILDSLGSADTPKRLAERGLVEALTLRDRAMVRTSHPLYGEMIRADIPSARAKAVFESLAQELEQLEDPSSDDLLRTTAWRLAAGTGGTPSQFMRAATLALGVFDYSLAERASRAAAQQGSLEARQLLAAALIGQGKFAEADEALVAFVAAAPNDSARGRAVLMRAENLFWNLGQEHASDSLLSAAEHKTADPTVRLELQATRAQQLFLAGRVQLAVATALPLLDRPNLSDRALMAALGAAGESLAYLGHPVQASELLDRHMTRVTAALPGFSLGPIAVLTYRTLVALFAGRLIEGARFALERHEEAVSGPQSWIAGYTAGILGLLLRAQGRVRSAARHFREAAVLLGDADIAGQRHAFLAEMACSLALDGDCATAESVLREADAARLAGHRTTEGWVLLPRIWITACRGEVSTAISEALHVADWARSLDLASQEAISLHDVVRLGEPRRGVKRLSELALTCDGELIPAFARHANALVSRDAPAVERESHAFEEMGAYLLAAEAAAEASRLYRDKSVKGSALIAAHRARALADLCEGVRTPALADIETSLPLTRREREVATLAAGGLSNREIADRLVVSPRTVGNQLHSVYSKLGVTSRTELKRFPGLS
jgi:DNA-binding CsgD family transcriptional regulator